MRMEVKKRKAMFDPKEAQIPYKTCTIIKILYPIFSFSCKIIQKKHLNFKWSDVNINQRLTHLRVAKSLLILINFL